MATGRQAGMGVAKCLMLAALALGAACEPAGAPKDAPPDKARPIATALTGDAANCPRPSGWDTVVESYSEEGFGRVTNRIAVTKANALLWNEAPIDLEQLGKYLVLTGQMEPEPILLLEADPRASCELMSRVVAATVVADLDCSALCRFELKPAE